MKVNQKILSIPPYISTSWKNVISLHLEEKLDKGELRPFLVIGLVNGSQIIVPEPNQETLTAVFNAYEKYLEQEITPSVQNASSKKSPFPVFQDPMQAPPSLEQGSPPIHPFLQSNIGSLLNDPLALFNIPLRLGFTGSLNQLLQHTPEAASNPDLPKELLDKIAELSKNMGIEQENSLPKPEPHCNCTHCQVLRAIRSSEKGESSSKEDLFKETDVEVSDDELRFKEWNIEQLSHELYTVSNPLNEEEYYSVFLGTPIGCTCGHAHCSHIKAVLNS